VKNKSGWTRCGMLLVIVVASCSDTTKQPREALRTNSSALIDCTGLPNWTQGTYSGGQRVQSQGSAYECKPWPYDGWCGQAGYEPGVTSYWSDAWILIDYCGSGSGGSGGSGGSSGSEQPDEVTGACTEDPTLCCPAGFNPVVLTAAADTYQTGTPLQCVVGLAGADTIAAQGGTSVVVGGPGNDTIQAASGNNVVVPGGGVDTVTTGTGNDTVYIFDLCELAPGDAVDTGTGDDTLVAPLPLIDLQARGLNVANVDHVVVQQNSCRSECVAQPDCSGHGTCAEGNAPGEVRCECDAPFAGANCESRFVDMSVPLPQHVSPDQVVLAATEGIRIGSGLRFAPQAGFNPVVSNLGSGSVVIGDYAEVNSIVASGGVQIGSNAFIHGFVSGSSAITLGSGAQVYGERSSAGVTSRTVGWQIVFDETSIDVSVGAGQAVDLAPGRYRSVMVSSGGTLRLSSGATYVDDLMIAVNATLQVESFSGKTRINVRDSLVLSGLLEDLSQPPLPANILISYAGTDKIIVRQETPFFFMAPEAPVEVTCESLPRCRLGSIWAKFIDFLPLEGGPVVDFGRLPGTNWMHTSEPPVVTVPELTPGRGTHPNLAALVDRDNPDFTGQFLWESEESGSGTAPYFHDAAWTGITTDVLDMLEPLPSCQNCALGWKSRLLSAGMQSPETSSAARFQTRTFDLFHGASFRVRRRLTHQSGAVLEGGQSLYVRLSDEVLLVPVLVVDWDHRGEDFYKALFDFIPYSFGFGVPSQPFRNPAQQNEPPDNVWQQCKIQLQLLQVVDLGDAPGTGGGEVTCNPSNPTFRDYVDDAGLDELLRDALPFDFEDYFGTGLSSLGGTGGLRPIILQIGEFVPDTTNDTCSAYAGKSDIANDMIQLNAFDVRTVVAHELGHVLLNDNGHKGDPELLMHQPAGTRLLEPECTVARSTAAILSDRYDEYFVNKGRAEPPPPPPSSGPLLHVPAAPNPALLDPSFVEEVQCCAVDGFNHEAPPGMCILIGGDSSSACFDCCREDPENPEWNKRPYGECSGKVVENKLCDVDCCLVDGIEEPDMTRGECEIELGGTAVNCTPR